jgi:hypothetical protein
MLLGLIATRHWLKTPHSIAVCGCNKHGGQPRLESLERGLAEAWQPVTLDMKLDIHAEANGEQVTMHCATPTVRCSLREHKNGDVFGCTTGQCPNV